MTNPSPGSGWWQASDGKWYPQQWEYAYFGASGEGGGAANLAYNNALQQANALGQQGWEMVNFTVQQGSTTSIGHLGDWCNITCFMKKPSVPQ